MIDRSQALQTFRVKRVSVGVAIKCKSLLERKTHGLNLGRTDDDGIFDRPCGVTGVVGLKVIVVVPCDCVA